MTLEKLSPAWFTPHKPKNPRTPKDVRRSASMEGKIKLQLEKWKPEADRSSWAEK